MTSLREALAKSLLSLVLIFPSGKMKRWDLMSTQCLPALAVCSWLHLSEQVSEAVALGCWGPNCHRLPSDPYPAPAPALEATAD